MMEYSVAFQCSMLLRSCVLGVLLGAAYDVFRLFRGTDRGLAALALDALYGLIFCTSVFVFVVCILQTEFRLWQIAGTAVGMGAWFALAGGWFRRALRAAARGIRLLFTIPVRIAQRVLRALRRIFSIPARIYGKKQKNLLKGTFHFPSNRLK